MTAAKVALLAIIVLRSPLTLDYFKNISPCHQASIGSARRTKTLMELFADETFANPEAQ